MDHDGHQVLELGGLGAPAIDGLDDGGQSGVHLDDQVDVPAVQTLLSFLSSCSVAEFSPANITT